MSCIRLENFKLNNVVEMPVVGIRTFLIEPKDAEPSVHETLKMGYRLVDTANERAVERGIKDCVVPRDKIFVSTKLWPTEY